MSHLSLCLLSGRPCNLGEPNESFETRSLLEQLNPAQVQAVLWVVTNILEDVAKFDLNSANKFVDLTLVIPQ